MRKGIFLLLLLGLSCSSMQPPMTAALVDSQYCEPAAQHLHDLCTQDSANTYCCQVVRPLKNGKTFVQFCDEKEREGVDMNAKCISNVTNCNDIDACTGSK